MQEHIRSAASTRRSTTQHDATRSGSTTRSSSSPSRPTTPARFLDLVQRLRTTEASAYTQARHADASPASRTRVERALNALDGEPVPATALRSLVAMTPPRLRRGPRHHGHRRRPGRACRPPSGPACARPASRIIDSLPELGGQLTTLYPEKWIFDVPGHPQILAKDLVELHRAADARAVRRARCTSRRRPSRSPGRTTSSSCTPTRGDLRSRTVIVAGGHGAFEPKKLPGYDMTAVGGPRRALPRRLQEASSRASAWSSSAAATAPATGSSTCSTPPSASRSCTAARASAPTRRRSARSWTPTPSGPHRPRTCPTRSRTSRQRRDRGRRSSSTPRTRTSVVERRRATRSCSSSASRPRSGR